MAYAEQIHNAFDARIEQQVVVQHIFTQFGVYGDGFELLRQTGHAVAYLYGPNGALREQAPHAGESFQIGNDGVGQLIKQRIKSVRCLCLH